jgi:acyl-CoA synthetase (AMP-forming)/AMP-acid ligase II
VALNIADLFEHAVDAAPDNLALKVGDRVATYADLERDSNKLAHFLASRGVKPGDHVAIYSKNSIEHVIAVLATVKVRATTINVNYRYVEGELDYLFENADVVALLFERTYADLVAKCAPKHPQLHTFVALPDSLPEAGDPGNAADISSFGGLTLEEAYEGQSAERDFDERSADDIHIIYTGGTTGFPKGVMWRHEDFWRVLGGGIDFYTGEPLEEMSQSAQANDPRMTTFPLSPLMHGGAQAGLLMHLFGGHLTVLEPKFDPQRTWEIIEKEKVQLIFMTGDSMARPLIEEYERQAATGTPYDGSSLFAISSSAAIFSPDVKKRWMDVFTNAVFTDSVGATETGFQGMGMQDKDQKISTDGPIVGLGPNSVVLGDDDRLLDPDTDIGKIGRLGRGGNVPVGYYKDPEKSAATFLEIDGSRYSVPGDFARIEEGNRVTLLGRGSNCVNTGGEKVYPEEVEMAVKSHPAVYDCLVVGIPDEKYGQAVAAVVELREGTTLELEELREFLRQHLSGYKLPRSLTVVPQIPRNATGKAQYPAAKEMALANVAV